MTVGTLRRLTQLTKDLPASTPVVTRGDYLHGPGGIYDLPTRTELIYICCAMGGCSWQRHPEKYYELALYWNGEP